jgi:hypothetical protein
MNLQDNDAIQALLAQLRRDDEGFQHLTEGKFHLLTVIAEVEDALPRILAQERHATLEAAHTLVDLCQDQLDRSGSFDTAQAKQLAAAFAKLRHSLTALDASSEG